MFIKANNNSIEKYPYSVEELRQDNLNTSFPEVMPLERLAEWGIYPVVGTPIPDADHTKNVTEKTPVLVGGQWQQVWEVTDATPEEILQRIRDLRASEYPPMADYLDGVVKGDQTQIDKYIADCLAVKAKYPKP